jgi:hypothetical protein
MKELGQDALALSLGRYHLEVSVLSSDERQ